MKKFSLFLSLTILLSTFYHPPATATSCAEYQIVFARGSGQKLNGPDWQSFKAAFSSYFKDANFYELGSKKQAGSQYPAVSIANFQTLLGAKISAGKTFTYGKSVKEGIKELETYVKNISLVCPDTKFILGGYSQGAQVISTTLPHLDATKIAYVTTFGDPKLYLPEGYSKHGSLPLACLRQNLSSYRINVPDCEVYEGILTATKPYQPSTYQKKLGTWCNLGDIICGSYLISDTNIMQGHSLYRTDGSHEHAARVAYRATHQNTTAKHRDVAFLIDVSDSMHSLIDLYKSQAIRLAKEVLDDGGRIALFSYNDLETEAPALLCDFDCNLSDFTSKLNTLRLHGGGDLNESVLAASLFTLNTLKWQKGATKSIVLLTDAGFHDPDRDGTTLNEVIKRTWEIDPVSIYAVTNQITPYTELTSSTMGQIFNVYGDLSLATDTILAADEEALTTPYRYSSTRQEAVISIKSQDYNNSSLHLQLNTKNTKQILVTVDDAILGFTDKTSFTIDDLGSSSTVTLTPFSTSGHKGESLIIKLKELPPHFTPKVPNTGKRGP